MILDRVLLRLREAFEAGDNEKLMKVANSLGEELSRSRSDVVNIFRNQACGYKDKTVPFEFILTLLSAWASAVEENLREDFIFKKLTENLNFRIILIEVHSRSCGLTEIKNQIIFYHGNPESAEADIFKLYQAELLEIYDSPPMYMLTLLGERMVRRFLHLF